MKEKEPAFYGNFAEPKEEKTSKRSEDVLLIALDKIEELEEQLKDEDKKVLAFDEMVGVSTILDALRFVFVCSFCPYFY